MKLLPKAVNSSGAVSPLMRASASSTPVTMPERARADQHLQRSASTAARPATAPLRAAWTAPAAASRRWCARPPAARSGPAPRRRRSRRTWCAVGQGGAGQHHDGVDEQAEHDRRRRQQDVVEEADRRRRAWCDWRIRPARCRPARRSACRSAMPMQSIIRLPNKALARPPSAPVGGDHVVNSFRFSALMPLAQRVQQDPGQPDQADQAVASAAERPSRARW